MPQIDLGAFDQAFEIDSKRYEIISTSDSCADDFFHPLLLYKNILKLCDDKFNELFENWADK